MLRRTKPVQFLRREGLLRLHPGRSSSRLHHHLGFCAVPTVNVLRRNQLDLCTLRAVSSKQERLASGEGSAPSETQACSTTRQKDPVTPWSFPLRNLSP